MADDEHQRDPQEVGAPARRPSRRAVTLVSLPLIALVVVSYVGDALAPSLVDTHPAWLIALNARNRNLALVTNDLDALSYYGIGFVRLIVSDPLFFLLGYWYGDAAVEWMERRTRTWGQMLRQAEGWFRRFAYPLVFLAPNNPICLFAGASGMSIRAFVVLNASGSLFRLWIIRVFGEVFESPLDSIVDWIGDNRAILLVVSVSLVVLSIALEAKGGETEVTALAHLDDELEATADEMAGATAGDDGEGAAVGSADEPDDRADASGDPDPPPAGPPEHDRNDAP
jgi:membrane protein DedA with SNARE-associated domain